MTAYHERNYDGRPTATALVRRGYVVITIDALMFGERRLMIDADLKSGWDRSQYSWRTGETSESSAELAAEMATLVEEIEQGQQTAART